MPQFPSLFRITETGLVRLYAGLIPLGFVAAWAGVAYARHGGVPNWLAFLPSFDGLLRWPVRRQAAFASAAKAQLWWECRQRLLSFPLAVACLVALILLFGFLMISGQAQVRPDFCARVGERPAVFALGGGSLVGFALCRPGSSGANPYNLPVFAATRPMTSTALVSAKLWMIAWSTFWAWLVVLLVLAFWLVWTNSAVEMANWWRRLYPGLPEWHVWTAGAVFAVLGMVMLSGRLLTDHLFLGLSGRPVFYLGGLAVYFLALWMYPFLMHRLGTDKEFAATFQDGLVWAAGAVILLKLLAAVWVCRALLAAVGW